MSSVTFSTTVGGDGSTVTDDDNATTGLGNGGALIRLVPMMQQVVTVASYVVTKAGDSSTSASAAAASATAASSSATAAAASYDSFDDRYLGAKSSDPSVDNDGNTLLTGALYWNTSSNVMKVWTGSTWFNPNIAAGYLALSGGTMTGNIVFNAGQTFTGTLPLTGGTMTGAITFSAGQFGTNVNTFLSTPSSANLAAALTDETGSGAAVFATSPTLVTPTITGYTESVVTLATSGSIALSITSGTVQSCAAAGTVTFTDSLSSGQSISLLLTNGSTYTINWPTTTWVTAAGNTAPTLSASNTLVFWKISSTLYGALVGKSA
jgi:hypothetical protein